jgi:Tfp pilus assembly protein PilF
MPLEGAAADGDVAAWTAFVRKGALPYRRPDEEPGPYVAGAAWRRRLGEAVRAGRGDHWLAWLQLGVAAFQAGDAAGAAEAWRRSLAREPSAWAHRNLAALAKHAGRAAEAADHYLRASALAPEQVELQVECGQALAEAARFEDLARWLAALPAAVHRAGRIALLAARSALEQGDFDRAERTLDGITLADVREGEIALTDLWFEIQERRTARAEGVPIDEALRERVRRTLRPPERLDFRMSVK